MVDYEGALERANKAVRQYIGAEGPWANLAAAYIERDRQATELRALNAELLAFVQSYVNRFGAKHEDEVDSAAVKEARTLIAKAAK